jgi:hypothetical protein
MPQLIDLGRLRLSFQGDYADATNYQTNDVVRYGGNLYVYINAVTTQNIIPVTASHWSLMLEGTNFRGPWATSTSYLIGDVVNYGGLLYLALANSSNIQPDDDATKWQKYLDGLKFEGEWNSATAYQQADVVRLGGRVYISKIDNTGTKPGSAGSSEEWEVLSDGSRHFDSWHDTETYYINDVVTIGGVEYQATENTDAGDDPVDGGPWSILRNGFSFVGNWTSAQPYEKNQVVQYGGATYRVVVRHTSVNDFDTDLSANKLAVFGGGFTWRSTWAANGTAYKVNDLVKDGLTTYIATASHTSGATFAGDSAYWDVFALGADYLPAQNTNQNKVLTTDGTDPLWTNVVNLNGVGHKFGQNVDDLVDGDGVENAELTNWAMAIQYDDGEYDKESYAQVAFRHKDPTSSSDIIVYSANGNDDAGWLSLGVTGKDFGDPAFTLTGGNTAYIFYEAEADAAENDGSGNLVFATGDKGSENKIVFAAGGFATGTEQMSITPDANVHVEIETPATSPTTGAFTVVGGVGITGDIWVQGDLNVNGDINLTGLEFIAVGNGASAFATTLTNPIAAFQTQADDYAQIAFRNVGNAPDSSTDFIAYANNGSDNAGYIDMGITSATFADPQFTITGANDGYIFMEAPAGTTGSGNLVFATGANGEQNKIIFAAGGLQSDNEQMSITPDQNVHIEIDTQSVSPATGALTVVGGVGIQGNLNVAGNTEITGNVSIQGVISVAGAGTTLATQNLAVSDPLIFVASLNSGNALDFGFIGQAAYALGSALVGNVATIAVENDIVTVTTSAAHGFIVGDFVTIAGATQSRFNGQHLITVTPSGTSFRFALDTDDLAAAASTGTATVSARAKYSGFVKDATDGNWKLFENLEQKPSTTVDFTDAELAVLAIKDLDANGIAASSYVRVNGFDVITEEIIDVKGDLIVGSGSNETVRMAAGANGTFLQADSTTATGLKYANISADGVLGAILTNTAANTAAQITALTGKTNGTAAYSTSSKYLSFKTASGVHEVGPVFLGFTVNYTTGELTAVTGTDETYDCDTFVEETLLPSNMTVSVTSAGILQLA